MLTVIKRALNRATFPHMKGTNFIRSHSIAAWLRSTLLPFDSPYKEARTAYSRKSVR